MGEVQSNEDATVYVKELGLIVTVKDTSALLSLGKLSEDHGYANEWTTGSATTPSRMARRFNVIRRTTCHSLSRVCRLRLPAPLHLLLQHRYRWTLWIPQCVQQQHEVRVWVSKHKETCRRLTKPRFRKKEGQRASTVRPVVWFAATVTRSQRESRGGKGPRSDGRTVELMRLKLLVTGANLINKKNDRSLPHQIRRQPKMERANPNHLSKKMKVLLMKETRFNVNGEIAPIRRVVTDILPCVRITFQKHDAEANIAFFRHVELEEKPNKKSKKGGAKRSVAMLKELAQMNCVSQDPHPKEIYSTERRTIGNQSTRFNSHEAFCTT